MASTVDLLFGIVTYKEKYWECASFMSLKKSFVASNPPSGTVLNIFVVDNTDSENWFLKEIDFGETVRLKYINLQNPGISKAYNIVNDFAVQNGFGWVVFLDQDTQLPLDSYSMYQFETVEDNKNRPVKIPTVYTNDVLLSPAKYVNYRSYTIGHISKDLKLKDISFINSGLMISSIFFEKLGGYNEKLKLDFCDHDFVEKIKEKLEVVQILNIKLLQDFSAHNHTSLQAITRYKIFCQDLKEFYRPRNTFSVFLFVDLPHLLKLIFKYRSLKFLSIRLQK